MNKWENPEWAKGSALALHSTLFLAATIDKFVAALWSFWKGGQQWLPSCCFLKHWQPHRPTSTDSAWKCGLLSPYLNDYHILLFTEPSSVAVQNNYKHVCIPVCCDNTSYKVVFYSLVLLPCKYSKWPLSFLYNCALLLIPIIFAYWWCQHSLT